MRRDLALGLSSPEMPADRLAFAIGVGRENQLRRIFHRGLERRDVLLLVGGDDVIGREVAVGIDAHPAPRLAFDLGRDFRGGLGQIADVTVARLDPVLVAEEAGRFSLGCDSTRLRPPFRHRISFPYSGTDKPPDPIRDFTGRSHSAGEQGLSGESSTRSTDSREFNTLVMPPANRASSPSSWRISTADRRALHHLYRALAPRLRPPRNVPGTATVSALIAASARE